MSWTVRLVGDYEDMELNLYVIGLAAGEDGEGPNLIFQVSVDASGLDDEEDIYCLTDEVGRCFYGGVVGWHVDDRYFTLTLTPEAANELEMAVESRFPLDVPAEQIGLLRQGLDKVFSAEPP